MPNIAGVLKDEITRLAPEGTEDRDTEAEEGLSAVPIRDRRPQAPCGGLGEAGSQARQEAQGRRGGPR